MHALTDVIDLTFPHTDAHGKPAATLENVEAVIAAFGVTVARPPLNSDRFAPLFGDRVDASPEHLRDISLSKLHDVCVRHGMTANVRTITRFVQMLGLEQEDAERHEANKKRLSRGLA